MSVSRSPLTLLRQLANDDRRAWPLLFCSALGASVLLRGFSTAVKMVASLYLPGRWSLRQFGAHEGAWAVVTGATSGLGEEFSRQLAAAGFNIVLVSRSHDKLEAKKRELESSTKAQIKTYAIDLAEATETDFKSLDDYLENLDITILVNMAGQSQSKIAYLIDNDPEELSRIIRLNNIALVRVTRGVAPGMAKRKRGLILNAGSGAGWINQPLAQTYAASKAFVHSFSQSVGQELSQHNVHVMGLNIFYVHTPISKVRRSEFMAPQAAPYVRRLLWNLGNAGGAVGSLPYLANPWPSHSLQQYLIDRLLTWKQKLVIGESLQLKTKAAIEGRSKA